MKTSMKSLLLSFTGAMALPALAQETPPEPPEFSADDIATPDREALAEAYAATTGAPKSKAIEQLRLQEQAVSWVNDLVSFRAP